MSSLVRFGVSMENKLLETFDKLIRKKGYKNRSEAIRDLIRENIVKDEWESADREIVGTITIIYNHHKRELPQILTESQHIHHESIISTMHVHLDHNNCLEVLAVKGKSSKIRNIADALISTKGVKHGKLVMTSTGKDI
ncbi:nickel-responsive transcriptional regulator NikR [candidate division KSB1 bacterium]|nr:MAG: nickel-responsive transcriptional regulator NikR [candidate division KSB1 bacterium]